MTTRLAKGRFFDRDPFAPVQYVYPVEGKLYSVKSPFQKIEVFHSPHFGRMLVLDGVLQLTERDEFFYHEMLAQVPLHTHPHPEKVLIVGGGDGGCLREVLKHASVRQVTLVEIDAEVIKVSQRYFSSLSNGFADPRTTVVIAVGAAFLAENWDRYDVIIVDSTDPVGPAVSLFTDDFFALAARTLGEEGIFVTQSESLHFHSKFVRQVQLSLSACFKFADLYTQAIATYPGNWWTFSIASNKYNPREPCRAVEVPTRYYSEEIHRHCFVPGELRGRIMSGELNW